MNEISAEEFERAKKHGAVIRKTLRQKHEAKPKPIVEPKPEPELKGIADTALQTMQQAAQIVKDSAQQSVIAQKHTEKLVEMLEMQINSNGEGKREPVRLQVNRDKAKLITSIDVIPIKIKG